MSDRARLALAMAQSDAAVERTEAIGWLLAHPGDARGPLADAVRDGTATAPEIVLRTLAAIGGDGAADALEVALLRGHAGEAFYASVALAESGAVGRAVLQRHADDPSATIRAAIAHVSSRMLEDTPPD